jgi:glycosyltransferase involved in cell wall biosynthesis
MRLFVVDPGLLSSAGHHYHLDLAFAEEAAQRGIPIEILANRQVEPDLVARLGCRPVFEVSTYTVVDYRPELQLPLSFLMVNESVEKTLKAELSGPFRADDLVLVHTVTANQLLGLWLWYRDLPEPRPAICLLLRFPPWFGTAEEAAGLAIAQCQYALRHWTALEGSAVRFATDNAALARYYRGLAGIEAKVLPIPIRYGDLSLSSDPPLSSDWPLSPDRQDEPGRPPCFTYLGEFRLEKGVHLLLDALAQRRPGLKGLRFVVQAGTAGPFAPVLDGYAAKMPEVEFVRTHLSDRDYLDLLRRSDAVIIPYDPGQYDVRTSHVMIEALGFGKPVLVTRGTWMDVELARLGNLGVRARAYDSDAIGDALELLAKLLPGLRREGPEAAALCRATHNPASFIDGLIGLFA